MVGHASTVPADAATKPSSHERACVSVSVGYQCMAVALGRGAIPSDASGSAEGFGPSDLAAAYDYPLDTTTPVTADSPIVAVIDAYDAPNVASDLNYYRASYGLPACKVASTDADTDWCFKKVGQRGSVTDLPKVEPTPADGETQTFSWADETTLDVQMVTAVCPQCRILLVESDDSDSVVDAFGHSHYTAPNMEAAVKTSVALGAQYVSMSWGQSEYRGETADEKNVYNNPSVMYVAAAGDSGFNPSLGYGPSWPANSKNVVSVGGTTLRRSANARGWSETAWGHTSSSTWSGTGSGCSELLRRARPGSLRWATLRGRV